MTAKQFTKYILHKNGTYRQCSKAIEEMAELIHVLSRYTFDGDLDRENLGEELADVVLMCRELAEAFDVSDLEIEERIQGKIDRYMGVNEYAPKNKSVEHIPGSQREGI
jgi:NTP pyrophosphatase (non-canonical NTP hydrolase)